MNDRDNEAPAWLAEHLEELTAEDTERAIRALKAHREQQLASDPATLAKAIRARMPY
ncbi:hypothetical protein NI17_015440 [Thermobifida halotolerans]|uniref:Uncharacterized protein n=1 Tax=Thermobifida halotolerans TaxID=483545 RepID=A0AA97LUI8_9ACTN|nr:hypothetical protein [Thermobifida halotolerans]UOE18230.1 hypothetical protein NI17_015440 [Thermobifida halotolerans]